MTNQELEKEIAKEATKASAADLNFLKTSTRGQSTRDTVFQGEASFQPSTTTDLSFKESNRILNAAARLASNENPTLYGGQLEFNMAVSEQVGLMMKHRSKAIGDATFTELVKFAYALTRILKGTVHNSESYVEACASLGTAAECAAKERK